MRPPVEPVSLTEIKEHLRIDADLTDQHAVLLSLIAAAREKVEIETRRSLVRQTRVLHLDAFPACVIEVPYGPLQSVASIEYVDINGAAQTLAASDYQVDTTAEPGRIVPAYGGSWPSARCQPRAVSITHICGYPAGEGSPTDYAYYVPAALKAAIKLLVGHWYENREGVGPQTLVALPMAVDALIWNHRILAV